MSKNRITLIVVLMSLASFGLMGFQYYWVRNAFRINQERFDQNVLQALSGTIEELEKGETSDVLLSQLLRDSAFQENLFEKIDPIELQIQTRPTYSRPSVVDTLFSTEMPQVSQTFRRMLLSRGLDISILSELENFFTYMTPEVASSMFTPDEMQILLQEKERQLEYIDKRQRFLAENPRATTILVPNEPGEINISEDALEKILKTNLKIELMNQAFAELAEGQQAILDRLDTGKVKSMLKRQLVEKGITEDFELGLLNDEGNIIGIGPVPDPLLLKTKGMQAKLFPNDILGKDNFLYVYFPEKNNHVLRQVWLPISSSLVFILVIIFCFVYAIRVILRQKALSDIKNDFINNMTHEFKTPLATVSLAVEALQDPELSTQDKFRSRYLGIIKDENKRLVSQVEKVLQAAALDKQDFKLKIEKIDIADLLESTVEHIGLQVEKRGGRIEFFNELRFPEIEGDAFHLTHIFNNLLDNANKYASEVPLIKVKAKDDGDQVIVSIEDNGIGMSKDAQKKIFDKFYRVPTGNLHDVKGFGLGLSYVKTMLEAHHGEIHVQSEPGKGSIFTINLPKKQ
ncbi:two-component system phosphate regulon sensor histidine kinase PhoR [Algoriphagus boseongensis]|uniref:histidine kinase n=1 Tax=Algoriphagus boseongensis TaxID=1442587 RepID=A0A4R6T704_9BACT|nr:HAMP domain-containing sensor histidine kinase [Algoriphagus boseongensis]TDQ16985.1 two-component system phosphate regulon sensor histidine kinase PhoR [Algoriphagus boseongensis]